MKKVLFSILCVAMSCANCNDVVANTQLNQTNNAVRPNFKLNFDNLSDLAKNNLLSNVLKSIVTDSLDVIRKLTKNEAALGKAEEVQSAQAYVIQLSTLEKRLSEADSVEKIANIQEISEAGKEEIRQNKKIVEQIQAADSTQKIAEIPGINTDVVERIKNYNNLVSSIEALKTITDALKIPHAPQHFIDSVNEEIGLLAQLETIDQVSKLKKFKNANPNLISEIEELEKVSDYIKNHTENIDGILKIPGLANEGIVEISRMQKDLEVALEQNKSLQKDKDIALAKVKQAATLTRNEYHFRMIVISLILRITFGFEFVRADDFASSAKEYDVSIVNRANSLLPYSAGVSRQLWRKAASHLGSMLQIVLSVDDIDPYIDILKKHMNEVRTSITSMNDTKSKFIFDALDQLVDILRRFQKNHDSMSFGDFNSRKNMILDKLNREKQGFNFQKQIKNDHKASMDNKATSKEQKKSSSEKNQKSKTEEKKKKGLLSVFE